MFCEDKFGPGHCCMFLHVRKENSNPTTIQSATIQALREFGFPVYKDEENHICYSLQTAQQDFGDDDEWLNPSTGIEYKGYCDSAISSFSGLVSAVVLAVLSTTF